MKIEATAWKLTLDKRSKECKYMIQVDNIDGRSEDKVGGLFTDWSDTGAGMSPTGSLTLLFTKDFGDANNWVGWAKQFPYKLTELTQSDKKKVLSWGEKVAKKAAKTSSQGRQCGKCGEYGHNARTCGQPSKPKPEGKKTRKKRVEKGPRKCKSCGKEGHNRATCKSNDLL